MSHTATHHLPYAVDLNSGIRKVYLEDVFTTNDHEGHQFDVKLFRGNSPVQLPSNATVTGHFIRYSDNGTVNLDGTASGNTVSVKLDKACYALPGQFAIIIKVLEGAVISTVFYAEGSVKTSGTDNIIDPGNTIPSLDELLARIATMENATADSRAAAQEARDAAASADTARAGINDALSQLKDTKAPGIEVEASGSIVTVDDAAALHAAQLVSHIEPVQSGSGDPSPENVRPISGWDAVSVHCGGKNLFHLDAFTQTIDGVTTQADGNGRFVMSGTTTSAGYPIQYKTLPDPIKILPGLYIVAKSNSDKQISVDFGRVEGDALIVNIAPGETKRTLIPESRAGFINRFRVYSPSAATFSGNLDIMLTYSDDTTFEPYQGQTLTAALPETVYGGTLDWKTGVLTVTHEEKSFTADDKSLMSQPSTSTHIFRWSHNKKFTTTAAQWCTHLKHVPTSDETVYGFYSGGTYVYMMIPSCSTVQEAMTWLIANDVKMILPLTETYTIQLTPQQLDLLKGANNVWSDTGDTSLVYVADTKMYIDNQIAAAVALALGN